MAIPISLKWGNNHHLDFMFGDGFTGLSVGTLFLVKERGLQQVSFFIPPDIDAIIVEQVWQRQGCDWMDLYVRDAPPLFHSIRAIHFEEQKKSLLWHVLHINGRPFDACGFADMDSDVLGLTMHLLAKK